jgi:hypothetical protein
MPRSKHRRKAGGKAIKRPGHGKPPREMPLSADTIAFMRFGEIYRVPFHAAWPDHQAGYMVDLVSDAGFDSITRTFHAVSRDKLFAEFMEPLEEEEDGSPVAFTLDEATAALAFLVEQDMVVVDGDQVLIPPRFVDAFYHSPASDGSISAVSVG